MKQTHIAQRMVARAACTAPVAALDSRARLQRPVERVERIERAVRLERVVREERARTRPCRAYLSARETGVAGQFIDLRV